MQFEMAIALLMEKIVRDNYTDKRSSGMQPLHWSILRYLNTTTQVSKDLTSVAGYVGTTIAPVRRAVSKLEGKGLVDRGSDPLSKRSVLVAITESGTAALTEDPLLKIARKIEALKESERDCLANALRQLMLMD